jgi:hypothetical protein
MKTYATLAEIPARFAYASSNMVLRDSDKPEYRAHTTHGAALNANKHSKVARNIFRNNAKRTA